MIRPVTPSEVQAVSLEIARVRKQWDLAGSASVSAAQVDQAEELVRGIRQSALDLSPSRHWLEWPTIALLDSVSAFRRVGERHDLEWYFLAFIAAAATSGVALVLGAFLAPTFLVALVVAAGAFVIGYAIAAILALYPHDEKLATRLSDLKLKRAKRLHALRTLESRLRSARDSLEHLSYLYHLRVDHDRLIVLHQQLQEHLLSRKNQLLLRDFRRLRGAAFEDLLAEVFETLGFTVQTTKASGDQGADLIVTQDGKRMAVQAKGYGSSVGNSAVQEAFAGMTFYECSSCVVITNSEFTRGAKELARTTGCYLVDGELIPTLIEGAVF
jgi:HJR/Mrr/RecB family endonuclease